MNPDRILILHDGYYDTQLEDLIDNRTEVKTLAETLANLGCLVDQMAFDPHEAHALADRIKSWQPALIFNLVETIDGSGQLAHLACSFLQLLGIPYTGSDAWSMQTTVNKLVTKRILAGARLPTPAWLEPDGEGEFNPGLRYLIKPVFEDGSVAIDRNSLVWCTDAAQLQEKIKARSAETGYLCFAEQFIDGREFNVSLLGETGEPVVLPLAEMEFLGFSESGMATVLNYDAKWTEGSFEYEHIQRTFQPRPGDGTLRDELVRIAKSCWKLFGLRGYARVDFRVDDTGQPAVIEINTNPCLEPDNGISAAASQVGIDFSALISRIAAEAGVSLQQQSYGNKLSVYQDTTANWQDQLTSRLTNPTDLVPCPGQENVQALAEACAVAAVYPMAVTPYYANLAQPDNPSCPIRRQYVPDPAELEHAQDEVDDPLEEERYSPVPGLIHRYPDRVLLQVSLECAVYCRHCSRKRKVGRSSERMTMTTIYQGIAYIRAHPEVRDVLLSGGDPLMLSDDRLAQILTEIRTISHVEVIRIGTRMPVVLPQRITPELVKILQSAKPLWLNTQFNHPREFTFASESALARLADAGIPLGNQTVLLKGINDSPVVMRSLLHHLVKNRVRPYYLYHCDFVRGVGHFRTTIRAGLRLMQQFQGHTSGFAVPSYIIDLPHGGGKVALLASHLALNPENGRIEVENFEGTCYVLDLDR
ncbi:MAG: KamA family radical SAM protein [Clostridia bacterium]|nr:KamA family radical SAM protein [Clostridia bacterium]